MRRNSHHKRHQAIREFSERKYTASPTMGISYGETVLQLLRSSYQAVMQLYFCLHLLLWEVDSCVIKDNNKSQGNSLVSDDEAEYDRGWTARRKWQTHVQATC
jgi:hypothetical protein